MRNLIIFIVFISITTGIKAQNDSIKTFENTRLNFSTDEVVEFSDRLIKKLKPPQPIVFGSFDTDVKMRKKSKWRLFFSEMKDENHLVTQYIFKEETSYNCLFIFINSDFKMNMLKITKGSGTLFNENTGKLQGYSQTDTCRGEKKFVLKVMKAFNAKLNL